jgi:hypothetical protein
VAGRPCALLRVSGGRAEAVTSDNLKSGVTKACWYDPEVNLSYLELARHYGTVIFPIGLGDLVTKPSPRLGSK